MSSDRPVDEQSERTTTRYQRRSAHLPHLGTEHCRGVVGRLPVAQRRGPSHRKDR
jgi:hypothetical protein